MEENNKLSIGKGIVITIVIIALCAVLVVLMTMLGVPMWIPFLGLTVCTAMGISFDVKTMAKFWVSAALGLGIGFMIGSIEQLGTIAIVLGAGGILLMIFGMVTKRMSAVFNSYTAIFLTVSTAHGLVLEPIAVAKGLVFGFVVIGLLPGAIMKMAAKKKNKE